VPSRLADILFSASLLAHAHATTTAASAAALSMTLPLVINGWETALGPASGRLARTCRATLITSIENLASINLSAVDPPACLRSFAGTVNEAGNVSPIAASSGTTARPGAGAQGRLFPPCAPVAGLAALVVCREEVAAPWCPSADL
jgi:hypothetical protein